MTVRGPLIKRIRATYLQFEDPTFFSGLWQTFVATPKPLKFFWTSCILLMIYTTLWNVWETISDYLEYPVKVTLTETSHAVLEFPTVTICNNNPVSCLKLTKAFLLDGSPALASLLQASHCLTSIGRQPLLRRMVSRLVDSS
jgi:hypothetical protein